VRVDDDGIEVLELDALGALPVKAVLSKLGISND
jgi:hypothetical protein